MARYSLLRYPGGKTRAIKYLEKFIPEGTKEIASPFFGGGSFEIALSRKGIKVWGYDNFEPLVVFWKTLLKNKKELENEVMKYFPLDKESFYSIQKSIIHEVDPIKVGAMFYVLNRSSFSGTGLSGGMSKGHPRFTESQIKRIREFNDVFEIEKLSFESSIEKHNCLVYADPPYMIKQNLYGFKGDMQKNFDHLGLSKILNKRKNFILSYNDCQEIRDLYKGHSFYFPSWNYGMSKDKKSNEILIVSKDLKF